MSSKRSKQKIQALRYITESSRLVYLRRGVAVAGSSEAERAAENGTHSPLPRSPRRQSGGYSPKAQESFRRDSSEGISLQKMLETP